MGINLLVQQMLEGLKGPFVFKSQMSLTCSSCAFCYPKLAERLTEGRIDKSMKFIATIETQDSI
jgi:hypothetical protein